MNADPRDIAYANGDTVTLTLREAEAALTLMANLKYLASEKTISNVMFIFEDGNIKAEAIDNTSFSTMSGNAEGTNLAEVINDLLNNWQ
jgi:hypothetical protein